MGRGRGVYFSGTVLGSPKLTEAAEAGRRAIKKFPDPQGTVITFPNQVLGVGLESSQPSWLKANTSRPPSTPPLPLAGVFPTRSLLTVCLGSYSNFKAPSVC